MRAYVVGSFFNLIIWAAANLWLAIKFGTIAYAVGCFLAWMLSYHLLKLGEMGRLPLLSGIERFAIKHARGASLLLFMISYLFIFSTIASPETVQAQLAASGSSRLVFWLQPGIVSGLLGGHAFFSMSFWLLDHGGLPPVER